MRFPRMIVLAAAALAACGGSSSKGSDTTKAASAGGGADLTGAGATFPYPIYSKWFSTYASESGVKINYQSIGSGGGIRQLSEQTVDFGATDAPMTDAEMSKAKGGPILHFPTVIGAVAVTYNVPGVATGLKLDGPTLAAIFLGKITKWNDSRIVALNPGVKLPDSDVLVVHRSDGSGTSYIFTDYLSSVSPEWAKAPGKGKEVQWPVGMGGKGNEGVAGQVKQTPGAVGYVELAYAKQNNLPVVSLKNASGTFVAPSNESATEAAAGAVSKLGAGTDYRISIVNAPGANAYPIASFTWIIVYKNQPDSVKAKKLAAFLHWAYTKGEPMAPALSYSSLPAELASRLAARADSLAPAGK